MIAKLAYLPIFTVMKKLYISCLLALGVLSTVKAEFKVETLNITVNAATPSADVGVSIFMAPLFKANYFPVQGAFSFTGLLNADINTSVLSESIGGGNYTPTKVYNNRSFERVNGFNRQPVWLMHNGLEFTSKFKGTGNQYIGVRFILQMTGDTLFGWYLVNLNAAGDELKILKVGYDDEGLSVTTGTEGENAPTTGIGEELANDLKIFPNPVVQNINLSSELKNASFSIYSLDGRVMQSGSVEGGVIPVDQLKSAVYVLEIASGSQVMRKKFVKD